MLFFDQEWLIFRQISPHRINFLQTIYNPQIHFWTNPVLEKTEHNFQVDAQSVVVVLRRCLYPHFIRFEQLETSLERILAEKYMWTPDTVFSISESFLGTKNTETRIFENWKVCLNFVPHGCIYLQKALFYKIFGFFRSWRILLIPSSSSEGKNLQSSQNVLLQQKTHILSKL